MLLLLLLLLPVNATDLATIFVDTPLPKKPDKQHARVVDDLATLDKLDARVVELEGLEGDITEMIGRPRSGALKQIRAALSREGSPADAFLRDITSARQLLRGGSWAQLTDDEAVRGQYLSASELDMINQYGER
jgi:hypothetical protein